MARRLLKWVATVLCLLIVLAAVANLRWCAIGVNSGGNYAVEVCGGAFAFWWKVQTVQWIIPKTAMPQRWWVTDYPVGASDPPRWFWWWLQARVPRRCFQAGQRWVTIPLWIPLVLLAGPTAYLWRTDRRRIPAGHCQTCGYNLTGNVSGRCPECGEAI
jgi:hypothetical protein